MREDTRGGWFRSRGSIKNFERFIKPEFAGKPCRYLEIGVWEGDSLVWMLENVLMHPESVAIAVDPWLADNKNTQEEIDKIYETAMDRLVDWQHEQKVFVYPKSSSRWLREDTREREHSFDVIYLDGNHTDLNVMDDAVLCWRLLKVGGIMIFDDYDSRPRDDHHVRHAVDAFMRLYGNGYAERVFKNFQYGLRKVGDVTW